VSAPKHVIYKRCPICRAALGRNTLVERFPVGRQVAFDPDRGRLWIICARCRGWSLAPLHEDLREAVEDAERAFAGAVASITRGNLTLARSAEGMSLLRIGRGEDGELAAWRYGARLNARWRRFVSSGITWAGVPVAGIAATTLLFPMMSAAAVAAIGAGLPLAATAAWQKNHSRHVWRSVVVRGQRISHWRSHFIRLKPDPIEPGGWALEVPADAQEPVRVTGAEAVSLLRRALPGMNEWGGTRRQVEEALSTARSAGSMDAVLRQAAEHLRGPHAYQPFGRTIQTWGEQPRHLLSAGHPVLRLAVEIAVNEEVERRALEGELVTLEAEWREAEEIAAVIDDLLIPSAVKRRFRDMLARRRGE
jgi:phage terminase Nu1 subunit (DNA packaging protein)